MKKKFRFEILILIFFLKLQMCKECDFLDLENSDINIISQ